MPRDSDEDEVFELHGGEYVKHSDGAELYCKTWLAWPQDPNGRPPRCVVTAFHGLGEHCLRYSVAFTHLAEQGIQVHSYDQRGHGRTLRHNKSESKGYNEGWDRTLTDAREAMLRTRHGDAPHFVLGIGYGGTLALHAAAKYHHEFEFAGAIAVAPMLEVNHDKRMPWIMEKLILGISPLLPRLSLKNRILADDISSDPSVGEEYFSDPFNNTDRVVVGTAADFIRAGRSMLAEAHRRLDMPLLIHVGDRDAIVDTESCKQLYELADAEDKRVVVWEGASHDLLNEPNGLKDVVRDDICSWILERCTHGPRRILQMSATARLIRAKL
ncbi:Alpha/Beta hydrolase protein [Hyaloraphidium curvatum]|nr:Alpha/Beta hydrolase protein [Hyaloraphidium curvatum]